MIGVVARPEQHIAICEFFELFKTPWEYYKKGTSYEAVLTTEGDLSSINSRVILLYGAEKTIDSPESEAPHHSNSSRPRMVLYRNFRLPIYSNVETFPGGSDPILTEISSKQAVGYYRCRKGDRIVARIGYDLFDEVLLLLTVGQPSSHAAIPALELHIRLLRELLLENGVELIEIPPVPDGYRFIVCLTHDVDHPSIRRHKLDHTMLGFLYRAIVGSLVNVVRRRGNFRQLCANWMAALKLPFVYLGIARDFWLQFTRYVCLEQGFPSSFFVIPFSGREGRTDRGQAPQRRASAYAASNISDQIRELAASGCEIGLHGIDAWIDSDHGREELDEIRAITRTPKIGVRMHWLYFDSEKSPVELERAGADYDSTVGYNNEVGYRAGTTQAYKPLNVENLLELPLHLMDTALFYPSHLHLTPAQAKQRITELLDNVSDFGGCLTTNWHDRSIAPERLWDKTYIELISEARKRGAWFATASQTVAWFRKRRMAKFEDQDFSAANVRAMTSVQSSDNMPGLSFEIYSNKPGKDKRINGLAQGRLVTTAQPTC